MPAVPGATHRQVSAGGIGLHVAEFGAGDPVVLLHGFPQHWYAWREVAAVEILPGAGHWLPEERPDEVAAAARALFTR